MGKRGLHDIQPGKGWAVVEQDGSIHMNTVDASRRGAITKWLWATANVGMGKTVTDAYLEDAWRSYSTEYDVHVIQVEVRPINDDQDN